MDIEKLLSVFLMAGIMYINKEVCDDKEIFEELIKKCYKQIFNFITK